MQQIGIVDGSFHISMGGWILGTLVVAGTLTWMGGLVSWLEVKKMGDERQASSYYTKF